MAKYAKDQPDPYIDPLTGLLRNTVKARSQSELDKIEAAFSAIRSYELERSAPLGRFDLNHLSAIHQKLFGDVYPWAGEIRNVVIEKGTTRFAMPEYIETAARDIFRKLTGEKLLQGLEAADFAKRAGHYLGEINVLHPFREGNGRAQRAFINQLAGACGYHIAWDRISREAMTSASIEAYRSSSDQLAQIIANNLTDRDRHKAVALANSFADREVPVVLAKTGESYSGRVLGSTER